MKSLNCQTNRVLLWMLIPLFALYGTSYATEEKEGKAPGSYFSVPDDPTNTRIYTLENGLKVYLSVNKDEPRIQTFIAVRAGSKHDPPETTGLAHYLEHMLFKGTDKIGTTDWDKESALLDKISSLYELHRQSSDSTEKKEIYQKIDQLSQEAAAYAIPNEYDKMISSLGAKYTNAYTSKEQTVYMNEIPSNELERWLKLESERFGKLVLRLFHTELETVYEEFNMSQDRDGSKLWKALFEGLFPHHTYGTQTTIGEGEHLKNPSLVNIHKYFETYYVPNNMAICLAGDLDPDETIAFVSRYFGRFRPGDIPSMEFPPEPPLKEVVRKEVFGQEAESVALAFRMPGANSREALMAELINGMLYNGQAGLIDLHLKQEQKVLDASAFLYDLHDYSAHILSADPREGQSLEAVEKLLLAQLEKIKEGDFDDWLMEAVINDYRLKEIKKMESNYQRASAFVTAFTTFIDWEEYVNRIDTLASFSREDIIRFARDTYGDNYVVVYKRQGEDPNVMKVEKPPITPIEANRESQSAFVQSFMLEEVPALEPVFIDYKKEISQASLKEKLELSYIENKVNQLFELYYILDMGRDHDRKLALAVKYLPYLGTDKYTPAELQKEFFRLGLNFDVFTSRDRVYVKLSGLDDSFEEGVALFEHVLAHVKADRAAYDELVKGILKEREDNKLNKSRILWGGLYNYAIYGPESPFRNILTEDELMAIDPEELTTIIRELTTYQHRIFYYGIRPMEEVNRILGEKHQIPGQLKTYPEAIVFEQQKTKKNKVYFVHYDMVQAQLLMVAKDDPYNATLTPYSRLFNEYFGSGLSSIVFQEIRETRALAYSAFASYSTPYRQDEAHYLRAYVATQLDKLPEAVDAMKGLLSDIPESELQFNSAVKSVQKKIETDRITKSSVFWNYENARRLGIEHDIRKDVYQAMQDMSWDKMEDFFNKHIRAKDFTYLLIGDRERIDMDVVRSLGTFEELSLKEIFNY